MDDSSLFLNHLLLDLIFSRGPDFGFNDVEPIAVMVVTGINNKIDLVPWSDVYEHFNSLPPGPRSLADWVIGSIYYHIGLI